MVNESREMFLLLYHQVSTGDLALLVAKHVAVGVCRSGIQQNHGSEN